MKATVNTDGGARGNPGPAGIGVVLVDERGEVIGEIARSLGIETNNVAEYEAVIAGLELARAQGVRDLLLRMDSELVARQLRGEWKIKNDRLRRLAVRARSLMGEFDAVCIERVGRRRNGRADALCNRAMDEAGLEVPAAPRSLF